MSNKTLEVVDELDAFETSLELADDDTEMPEIIGPAALRKAKKDLVRHMWAGQNFAEACGSISVPIFQAARWRNPNRQEYDIRFNMWCELYETENEQVRLARITKKVYDEAEEDARLGLQVLKARDPEKWNPSKVVKSSDDDDNRRRFLPQRSVINANFREPNGK